MENLLLIFIFTLKWEIEKPSKPFLDELGGSSQLSLFNIYYIWLNSSVIISVESFKQNTN